MIKSKLAVWSFVLSLLPIVIPIIFLFWTLVNLQGNSITVENKGITVEGQTKEIGDVVSFSIIDLGVSGILSVFAYIFLGFAVFTSLFSIVAIVLGIIGLIKIKKNNLEGKWLAVTGIIVGSICLIS